MLPVMLIIQPILPLWLNLMIGQAFGALIFWKIDQWIFHGHKKDNIEEQIESIVSDN